MDATNSRSGGQLLGWCKNHLVCQEMLSRGRHKVRISGWGALLASFCKKDISKGDFVLSMYWLISFSYCLNIEK